MVTTLVQVFVAEQTAVFKEGKFAAFKSTKPRPEHSLVISTSVDVDEQKTLVKDVLIACCKIVIDANSSHGSEHPLSVRIGQGVNQWLGEMDPDTKKPISKGHKSCGNIQPLYKSDGDWMWVMKR